MTNPTFKKFKPFQAPMAYKWKDPDTGRAFFAPDLKQLIQLIVAYRSQNRLHPIEELGQVIENYLCGLPENIGKCHAKPLHRKFSYYLKGGIALLQNMYYGDQNMVSQQEADTRAAICLKCPFNVFPDRDMFIRWSDDIAELSVGPRKSKYHEQLGNCSVCSCPLRPKVWFKGDFGLDKEQQEIIAKTTPACWQLVKINRK